MIRNQPYHKAMELRLQELREKRTAREKLKDRIIGFFIAVVLALILGFSIASLKTDLFLSWTTGL